MDIVYVLGNGSKYNNNEIRYSIRGVVKHIIGFSRIFIVGELPNFLIESSNLIHIPFRDEFNKQRCKQHNIKDKLLCACGDSRITDNFLFFNDDHFILNNFNANTFPYYCFSTLKNKHFKAPPGGYKIAIKNSLDVLESSNKPTKYFDIHCPMRINKQSFRQVMGMYDWGTKDGYVIKSIYCNTLEIEGSQYSDLKFQLPYANSKILETQTINKLWFSIGDNMQWKAIEKFFISKYPNKSIYEN